MEVNEITIPSPDFGSQTFGPVTVENMWKGPVDRKDEVPVAFALERCWFLGIVWYREMYRTRGVFQVMADQITLWPTAPVLVERAAWWRRFGYSLLTRESSAHNAI